MVKRDAKRILPDENEEFLDFVQYSFFPDNGPVVRKDGPLSNLYSAGYDCYGYFEDDELRFGLLGTDLDATVRGGETTVSVMRYAATPPEHRRTGALKRGMETIFGSKADLGVPFIFGRAFKPGMYQVVGVGRVCNWQRTRFRTDVLLSAVDEPRGRFRRLDRSDWHELDAVHRRFADGFSLSLDRTEGYWRSLLNPFGKPHHIAGWEVDGELRGYIVYKFSSGGEHDTIHEVDMGYVDHEAYRHLLYYLGNHDSQARLASVVGPEGQSPFDVVDRPDTVEVQVYTGPILRVADVKRGLEVPSYPTDVTDSVTIRVVDDLLPENDGRYELSVRDGEAKCVPTDAKPDATAEIGAVARLLVGFRDVETLENLTGLTVHDDAVREILASMFPEEPSFVRDEV